MAYICGGDLLNPSSRRRDPFDLAPRTALGHPAIHLPQNVRRIGAALGKSSEIRLLGLARVGRISTNSNCEVSVLGIVVVLDHPCLEVGHRFLSQAFSPSL